MDDRVPIARLGYPDLARLRPYHENPLQVRAEWACDRFNSLHTLRLSLLQHWGQADLVPPASRRDCLWRSVTADGWGPFFPPEWPDHVRNKFRKRARRAYAQLMTDFRVEPVNDRVYRDMLAECQARGIRVALFLMPESPRFRTCYPPGV